MATYQIDPAASQVWIEGSSSVHPIHACASGLSGWIELSTIKAGVAAQPNMAGEVRIEVDRLASGNALVDRETRRRIDAKRYPEIVGTVGSATRITTQHIEISGTIEFRGQQVEVSGICDVTLAGSRIMIDGSQRFDVRDWGLTPPRIGLLRVHNDIEVRIHVEAS